MKCNTFATTESLELENFRNWIEMEELKCLSKLLFIAFWIKNLEKQPLCICRDGTKIAFGYCMDKIGVHAFDFSLPCS